MKRLLALLLILTPAAVFAQGETISDQTSRGTLESTDIFECEDVSPAGTFKCTLSELEAFILGAASDLDSSGDVNADSINAAELDDKDSPGDEECLTYESGTADLEWQACSAGAGDVTDVWGCASGDCNTPTIGSGEKLDGGTATVDSTDEGILLPRATSCAGATSEGQVCWDTDNDSLYVGDGAAAQVQTSGSGDVTDVWTCATGNCSDLTATTGDKLDAGAADSLEIPNAASPTVNATGEIALDTTEDELIIYDGSAVRVIEKELKSACMVIENLAAADDNTMLPIRSGQDIELVSAFCHCQGTCTTEADLSLEYVEVGTGGPTITAVTGTITCEDYVTGDSATALSGNTTVTALDVLRFDVDNAVSPETDEYAICVNYRLVRN